MGFLRLHPTNLSRAIDAIHGRMIFLNLHLNEANEMKQPLKHVPQNQPLKCVPQNSYLDL